MKEESSVSASVEQIAREAAEKVQSYISKHMGLICEPGRSEELDHILQIITAALAPLQAEVSDRDATISAYAETLKSFGWKPADEPVQDFLARLEAELEQAKSCDDAFALVNKAREEGWYVTIHTHLEDAWLVIFSKYSKPKSEQWMAGPDIVIDATDPDLRRAIVVAFLKLKK